MKGIIMYSKIQQCKEDGLNKSQASRELGVSRGTIRRYWDMSLESYEKLHNGSKRRKRKLDSYQKYMLHLLFKHNEYKSSQILDLMKERYPEQAKNFKYSTVNREVKLLRQEHNVPNASTSVNIRLFRTCLWATRLRSMLVLPSRMISTAILSSSLLSLWSYPAAGINMWSGF